MFINLELEYTLLGLKHFSWLMLSTSILTNTFIREETLTTLACPDAARLFLGKVVSRKGARWLVWVTTSKPSLERLSFRDSFCVKEE